MGLGVQVSKQEITKVASLVNNGRKYIMSGLSVKFMMAGIEQCHMIKTLKHERT